MTSTEGNDELHGYGTDDLVSGGLGNDSLYGEGGNDVLVGGVGNDVMDGGAGSDIYRFERGWGQDTINNYDTTAGKIDALEFGADIKPEDLVLTRTDSHLNIALKGSSDKITVRYFFSSGYQLEEIRFANGTTWSLAQVKVMVMTSTDGNDELHGYGTDDLVSGGLGNDSLYGEGGNDVLVGGVGNDVLDG
ncbi:calcium-binding protein, partial [Pseudomonas sp. CH235]|uniref:calcium-binding protein n=1 Tax=Pseudomonas sp. CH235 TaxID=1634006 RepID=UPI00273D291C